MIKRAVSGPDSPEMKFNDWEDLGEPLNEISHEVNKQKIFQEV
jgi:hypothetical protein